MKTFRVLLVEDNEELRRLYKDNFEAHNFEVFESADGQTAVDDALIRQPDAIILDLMLPKRGGLGVLRIIRTLPELKNVPVIILTALDNGEYREVAKGMVQGYFLKTQIKPGDLVRKVREFLEAN